MNGAPLLTVQNLRVEYPLHRRKRFVATDDVSFEIGRAETLALVGESGSGKSTIGRAILGLVAPAGGTIEFDGEDITHASFRQRRRLAEKLQVVFQNPYGTLNPTKTIAQTLVETLMPLPGFSRRSAVGRMRAVLDQVAMPQTAADRFPREFSGGQRQRIAIARALMPQPHLIVCDEPVSALDLSIQAQIINLLVDLQRESQLSYLFISHDLAVVRHVSPRVMVLQRGRVVESGDTEQVYSAPAHPYTQKLLEAIPVLAQSDD